MTPSKGNFYNDFLSGFFFSTQTLTTVGYGGISP
ncbi:ion channel [Tenacibaculum maritimum]